MKPQTGIIETQKANMVPPRDDFEDVSLDKAYEVVGLMITESRYPDLTIKGRRDGFHLPQGSHAHKSCSEDNNECQKVRRYKENIASLCKNRIPLCIEVLMCPECELSGQNVENLTSHVSHDVSSVHSNASVLLEQWTIQQVQIRSDNKPQPIQALCNAVRSHLCFSQLSAWLQLSQGVSPRHIFYRLTAPGEWFVHKFVMQPQKHTFPDAIFGKGRFALRVTLSSLPRTAMTPYEISVADREKLFGIKHTPSPIQIRFKSSTQTDVVSEKSTEAENNTPVIQNERIHSRSKSVKGFQDLIERRVEHENPASKVYGAQRCLSYLEKPPETIKHSFSDAEDDTSVCSRLSAEKLASFTSLPSNHINKLDIISCNNGFSQHRVPSKRANPSTERSMALKSPKVLFTRTSMYCKENFFPSHTDDAEADLDSDIDLNDNSFDTITPKFDLPEIESLNLESNSEHYETNISENISNGENKGHDILETDNHISNGLATGISIENKNGSVNKKLTSDESTPTNSAKLQNKHHPGFPKFSKAKLFKQTSLQSSPAPVKKYGSNSFSYDESLNNVKSIKSAISCSSLLADEDAEILKPCLCLSSSAPALSSSNRSHSTVHSHNSLLGNFEESLINGRIAPDGKVEGYTVDVGASGSFCPKHVTLPVESYYFNGLSDDDAPSPYLGYVDLTSISPRGYEIPRKGTLQITLFYPTKKVYKMFVVTYNLLDMPPRSQTFIRQKTVYAPCQEEAQKQNRKKLPTYLRYLIHLRFKSTKSNKIYLHTDIRLIFARDKFEFDSRVASYELRSFIESPTDPKYSPLK